MAVIILAVVLTILTGAHYFRTQRFTSGLARVIHSFGVSAGFGVSRLSQHRNLKWKAVALSPQRRLTHCATAPSSG
jgi:hypothetical protein